MNAIVLIARREFFAYLRSPLGSAIIAACLLIDGILFYFRALTPKLLSAEVLQEFIYSASGTTMIAGLVLSMRLLAEERQTGTLVLLNTAPVKDSQIVLGKYLSALTVLSILTLLTAYMPILIFVKGSVSVGHILVGYLGLLLLGSASIAIGLFGSALARSQIVAAIIGAGILTPMVLLWAVAKAVDPPLNRYVSALALHHDNFRPFMLGRLDLGAVAYYLVVSYFFLLAATKVLEARRWR
ncbi:MAG: ABC transporter permease [Myxococcota bacterium]|nr:ABC transporter permease [Myxococcota bacterium]